MRDGKELDCFDSAIGWSLVREDCALGLDALLAAHDTLRHERADGAAQIRNRGDIMDRLSIAIQIAAQALDDIKNAERVALEDREPRLPLRVAPPPNPLGLTKNDIAILQCAAEGMVDKAIAQRLNYTPERIHCRWRSIRLRLCALDRSNAVGIAVSLGIIRPPSQTARLLQGAQDWSDVN